MSVVAIVDDQNSQINYSGTWNNANDVAGVIDNTLSFTTVPGSSFTFNFDGSQIEVIGSLAPTNSTTPVVSLYSVDGSSPSIFASPNVTQDTPGVTFFLSAVLADGPHQLFVNVTNVSGELGYILDAIAYVPQNHQPSATYVTSALSQPTSTVFVTSAPSGKSSVPVGAIVGGVIGGVALLLGAVIAIWFLCFRRQRGKAYFYKDGSAAEMLEQEAKSTQPFLPVATPDPSFTPSSHYTTTHYSSPPTSEPDGTHSVLSSSTYQRSGPSTVLSVANPSGVQGPSPNQPQSKAAEAGILSVPQPTTFYADSGVRFTSAGGPSNSGSASGSGGAPHDAGLLVDVPPMYTAN